MLKRDFCFLEKSDQKREFKIETHNRFRLRRKIINARESATGSALNEVAQSINIGISDFKEKACFALEFFAKTFGFKIFSA